MSYLVGNPEDRFSCDEAQMFARILEKGWMSDVWSRIYSDIFWQIF